MNPPHPNQMTNFFLATRKGNFGKVWDMGTKTFEYPLLIREHHLDTFGHVNNAVYLQIFEEARWEIIDRGGYGMKKVRESGQGPVILDVHLSFKHELKLRSQVTIFTQLVSYESKICKLKQWIEDKDAINCAEALFTCALFDLRERKLILPTEAWLKALS